MKITLNFCFILCLLFSSCSKISIEEKKVHKIINRFNRSQEKQRDLRMVGVGSSIPENIEKFILRFKSQQNLTQDQTRDLIIECTNELLALINADDEVRPYLDHYPFKAEDIDLMICFVNENDQLVQYPFIAFAAIAEGTIYTSTTILNCRVTLIQSLNPLTYLIDKRLNIVQVNKAVRRRWNQHFLCKKQLLY